MFEAWGRFVHRHRVPVLLASATLLVLSLTLLAQGGQLQSYQLPSNTESGEASQLIEREVGSDDATFLVVFSHPTLTWRDAAYRDALEAALAPLRDDPLVKDVRTAYDAPTAAVGSFVSTDGHRTLAVVEMEGLVTDARDAFPAIREKLRSPTLGVEATGTVAIHAEMQDILDEDLRRSEVVALPVIAIVLLLVFGTLVAALLPLGVGLLAVAAGLAGVFLAARFTDMSVYATNIVTLIGLGVAIDYSLFMVNRFREELARGASREDALARTMATAGRATTFSGLTVAVGLAGLAFYKGLYFASIGIAGALVVAFAVIYALTFLAAVLALLGPRVDRLRVPVPRPRTEGAFWGAIARGVMKRPILVLVPTLALVILAGSPFLRLHMGSAGVEMLPEDAETRQALETVRAEFPGGGESTIRVVLEHPGDPLTRERIGALYDHTRLLADLPGVTSVTSIVDVDPRFGREQYQDIYAGGREDLPDELQGLVDRTVGETIVVVDVSTRAHFASKEAHDLVRAIRALEAPGDARILVTGDTALDLDALDLIYKYTPAALVFIVVTTYLLLLVQTGSVVLPAKAIVMNFLSIAASFGALVWIFQEGNLSAVLDFTPAPIDPSLPVLLFCIVFGLSMDYEVLLLSRMHEEWDRTGDNTAAVANGLAKSGRLITSAAAIMVLVFGAFALAQVTIIKAIGVGLALAILIDATLVRALVVPATMRLMGNVNWWAPAWLSRWLKPLQH